MISSFQKPYFLGNGALKIGSPVVLVDSPPFVKTAEPMPMLKPNDGLLNVGDPGRLAFRYFCHS